ncbi:MAG: Holliday junction branch migration protein RuvA [Myxococcota bacterium]
MIGHLRGTVFVRDALTGTIVLDVNGVGYQLTVSWQTFAEVPEESEDCGLWVHTHVREDVLALYGFGRPEERRMFQLLTSVPQVGPKNAVAVLGGFPLVELLEAIGEGQRATLERIPGVGKRTAERIILDLKEKVEPLRAALGIEDGDTDGDDAQPVDADDALDDEARAVLVNLGWKPKVVDAALKKARSSDPAPDSLDALVRRTLSALMSR